MFIELGRNIANLSTEVKQFCKNSPIIYLHLAGAGTSNVRKLLSDRSERIISSSSKSDISLYIASYKFSVASSELVATE